MKKERFEKYVYAIKKEKKNNKGRGGNMVDYLLEWR
jgi:hypothetical protein